MTSNANVLRATVSLALLVALSAVGCGKVVNVATKKAVESAASKNGVKLKIGEHKTTLTAKDGATMTSSDNGNNFTMKTADGTVTMASGENAKVPADFPKDVPLYPGAKVNSVTASSKNQAYSLQFTTSDSMEKVAQHYKKEAIAQGWKAGMTMSTPGDQATQMLDYTKGNRTLMLNITKESNGASILLNTGAN